MLIDGSRCDTVEPASEATGLRRDPGSHRVRASRTTRAPDRDEGVRGTMVWDDAPGEVPIEHDEQIELVGTNLRLRGTVSLGRFGRLTDLINASSGYVRVRDAQLLQRNGDP